MEIDAIDEIRPRTSPQWQPMALDAWPPQAQTPELPQITPNMEQLLAQIFSQIVSQLLGQVLGAMGGGLPDAGAGAAAPVAGAGAALPAASPAGSLKPPSGGAGLEAQAHAEALSQAQAQASSQVPSPTQPTSQPTGSGAVDGGGPDSVTLRNNTDQPMQVAFFRNLAPGEHPSFNGPEATFTIPPHASTQVSMPEDWQGRAQKWNGSTQDYANWAELNFEKSTHKIWFDESDIPGRNSSMKISAPDGAVAGSDKSLLAQAPADVRTTDSSGAPVIKAPQWFTGETHQPSVQFLDNELGTRNAYVLPDDNNAVRTTSANSLTIDFGNA